MYQDDRQPSGSHLNTLRRSNGRGIFGTPRITPRIMYLCHALSVQQSLRAYGGSINNNEDLFSQQTVLRHRNDKLMVQEKNKTTGPLPLFPPPSFLPSFLPSFFITDSFFLAKNIGDGIQTCVSKFKPSLVQGLVLLGIVGRSDGQDIHLSHQLSHQRFLSVSLLLVSLFCLFVYYSRLASNIFVLWIVKIVLFCFFSFFCYNTKILLQSQSSYNNNNSKTRNQILQSLPCCAQHSNSKQAQQLASFKGAMKAK